MKSVALKWTRPIPTRWIDAWQERLAMLDAQRLTVMERPGSLVARLEYYPSTRREAQRLVRNFGGQIRQVKAVDWLKASEPRGPIFIGQKFIICAHPKSPAPLQKKYPQRTILLIPAGMAFGTGDHATTAMLLRELLAVPPPVGAADVGTGSGILALALRALGAEKVLAFDNDPIAVRVARANEIENFSRKKITWACHGFEKWKAGLYDVMCANLTAELLMENVRILHRRLQPDGTLLTSGILSAFGAKVKQVFTAQGFHLVREKKRGAWLMLRWTRLP